MEAEVPASALLATVGAAAGSELESVELFDEFNLGGGRKSLAVTVVIRAADRTMTDQQAQQVRLHIIEQAETELDVKLRGGE